MGGGPTHRSDAHDASLSSCETGPKGGQNHAALRICDDGKRDGSRLSNHPTILREGCAMPRSTTTARGRHDTQGAGDGRRQIKHLVRKLPKSLSSVRPGRAPLILNNSRNQHQPESLSPRGPERLRNAEATQPPELRGLCQDMYASGSFGRRPGPVRGCLLRRVASSGPDAG